MLQTVSKRAAGVSARVCAVLGGQWGDEGKGKLADVLAGKYDIVARFNGGNNAGHTVVANGKKYAQREERARKKDAAWSRSTTPGSRCGNG